MNPFLKTISIVLVIFFTVSFTCCFHFPVEEQNKTSPVDHTMDQWNLYKKYAGRNNEIVLGPYRSVNKLNPEYHPKLDNGKDPGVLNYIFKHKQYKTEERYYLLYCINETDTAILDYGLKYSFTEDHSAVISHPKNWGTNIVNESYVISGTIRTNLYDDIWTFRIGPYAIELKTKEDSSFYEKISGSIEKNLQITISPKPISPYTSPLLRNRKNPLTGISFFSNGYLAAMEFSPSYSVLMKKNIAREYRLILAAICSAMYDLKGN